MNVVLNMNRKKINPLQYLRFMQKRLPLKDQPETKKNHVEVGISFQMMKMIYILIQRQSTKNASLKIA